MICEFLSNNDSYSQYFCQQNIDSVSTRDIATMSNETVVSVPIIKHKQVRQRRKTILYGEKDRSSAIYKYIKEKQKCFLTDRRAPNSAFSPEEDRILVLLVKKLGPKFHKITKYFPGKTMNMLKNRYYKSLKDTEATIIPKEIEEELAVRDKEKRVMGKKIIKIWPEQQRMSAIIDNSDLFPEAKQLVQSLFSEFSCLVDICLKNL